MGAGPILSDRTRRPRLGATGRAAKSVCGEAPAAAASTPGASGGNGGGGNGGGGSPGGPRGRAYPPMGPRCRMLPGERGLARGIRVRRATAPSACFLLGGNALGPALCQGQGGPVRIPSTACQVIPSPAHRTGLCPRWHCEQRGPRQLLCDGGDPSPAHRTGLCPRWHCTQRGPRQLLCDGGDPHTHIAPASAPAGTAHSVARDSWYAMAATLTLTAHRRLAALAMHTAWPATAAIRGRRAHHDLHGEELRPACCCNSNRRATRFAGEDGKARDMDAKRCSWWPPRVPSSRRWGREPDRHAPPAGNERQLFPLRVVPWPIAQLALQDAAQAAACSSLSSPWGTCRRRSVHTETPSRAWLVGTGRPRACALGREAHAQPTSARPGEGLRTGQAELWNRRGSRGVAAASETHDRLRRERPADARPPSAAQAAPSASSRASSAPPAAPPAGPEPSTGQERPLQGLNSAIPPALSGATIRPSVSEDYCQQCAGPPQHMPRSAAPSLHRLPLPLAAAAAAPARRPAATRVPSPRRGGGQAGPAARRRGRAALWGAGAPARGRLCLRSLLRLPDFLGRARRLLRWRQRRRRCFRALGRRSPTNWLARRGRWPRGPRGGRRREGQGRGGLARGLLLGSVLLGACALQLRLGLGETGRDGRAGTLPRRTWGRGEDQPQLAALPCLRWALSGGLGGSRGALRFSRARFLRLGFGRPRMGSRQDPAAVHLLHLLAGRSWGKCQGMRARRGVEARRPAAATWHGCHTGGRSQAAESGGHACCWATCTCGSIRA